jgi:hypothetical protein
MRLLDQRPSAALQRSLKEPRIQRGAGHKSPCTHRRCDIRVRRKAFCPHLQSESRSSILRDRLVPSPLLSIWSPESSEGWSFVSGGIVSVYASSDLFQEINSKESRLVRGLRPEREPLRGSSSFAISHFPFLIFRFAREWKMENPSRIWGPHSEICIDSFLSI